MASRNNLNYAELLEVMIECESLRDTELFNNNLARAVCKAPILISETFKCLPSKRQIHLSNLVNFCQASAKESIAN